jgi:hypothetical protein
LSKVLSFVTSDAFQNDSAVQQELKSAGVDLSLLTLPLIFSANQDVASVVRQHIKKLASPFLSRLNLDFGLGPEELFSQLTSEADTEAASELMDTILARGSLFSAHQLALALLLSASALQKCVDGNQSAAFARKLIRLAVFAVENWCHVKAEKDKAETKSETEDKVEAEDSAVQLIREAARKRSIPAKIFELSCRSLSKLPSACADAKAQLEMGLLVNILGARFKSAQLDVATGMALEVFAGKEFDTLLAKISALEQPPAPIAAMDFKDLASLFEEAQIHCSKQVIFSWTHSFHCCLYSYNAGASAVKIYNAKSSLESFEDNSFFFFENRSSLLQRWRFSRKF